MNKSDVKELLKQIVVAYPNFEVSEPRFNLWCEMMQDISFKYAQKNLVEHIKTNRFAPTIADIRGAGKHSGTLAPNNICEVTGRPYEFYVPEPKDIN